MSRYDHEQRVRIVSGPHRYLTGVTQPKHRGDQPDLVRVLLDTSGVEVLVDTDAVRAEIYGDVSGMDT